jgi:hypothetical protein
VVKIGRKIDQKSTKVKSCLKRPKSTVKSTSKSASKKKGPKTHFIHAGLAQIDFEAEFAKVVKNPLGGSPH